MTGHLISCSHRNDMLQTCNLLIYFTLLLAMPCIYFTRLYNDALLYFTTVSIKEFYNLKHEHILLFQIHIFTVCLRVQYYSVFGDELASLEWNI